jgi:hypothetical protein
MLFSMPEPVYNMKVTDCKKPLICGDIQNKEEADQLIFSCKFLFLLL